MNFSLESLLEPIAGSRACGEDLSFSNEFHAIKKAKTQDDPLLALGDWVTEPKQADWQFVAEQSSMLLANKSKDIRLLTWLSEAWAHLYGFQGIASGLELSYRLLEQYWLKLHPEIEEDDLDQRLGLLKGLVNQLPVLIKKTPLMETSPAYSLFDYENFLYQHNQLRKQSEDEDHGVNAQQLEQFESALATSAQNIQLQNYQNFELILAHWESLKQVLDQLMQLEAPSFAQIDSQLEDIHKSLKKIYKPDLLQTKLNTTALTAMPDSNLGTPLPDISNTMTTIPQQQPQNFQASAQSHLQNREQAIKLLQDIAEYFKTHEPHSPVSYMLQKTVKWSQMPLHEWLAQVIKNENPLESVQELLGVPATSNETSNW
ncbi:type VI secretion system protein TssA [Acinetobacter sp. GXMZU3951]